MRIHQWPQWQGHQEKVKEAVNLFSSYINKKKKLSVDNFYYISSYLVPHLTFLPPHFVFLVGDKMSYLVAIGTPEDAQANCYIVFNLGWITDSLE